MKHFSVLVSILLCSASLVRAQTDNSQISIPLYPNDPITGTKAVSNLSSVSLQIGTADTTVIGYISDTASYTTYTLIPQRNISDWLQGYVDSAYRSLFSSSGSNISLFLKNFDLSESISTNSIYIHIQASISASSVNSTTANWEIDTLLRLSPQGGNYNFCFENAIQTLISYSADKVSAIASPGMVQRTGLSTRRISSITTADISNTPILQDSLVNEGAFATLNELKNNNPSIGNIVLIADRYCLYFQAFFPLFLFLPRGHFL